MSDSDPGADLIEAIRTELPPGVELAAGQPTEQPETTGDQST